MRVFKPKSLGILHRTYSKAGKHIFVVSPIIFFDLKNPASVLMETTGWSLTKKSIGSEEYLDEGMPKARNEVLIFGKVHAPGKQPVSYLEASFSVGQLRKKIRAIGNRVWQKKFLRKRATKPAPFVSLPMQWERAWGGPHDPINLNGTGLMTEGKNGSINISLPNFEYVDQNSRFRIKKQEAVGFGPLDISSPCRKIFAGTYDENYFKNQFPDLPDDLSFDLYNRAQNDQQVDANWIGDEEFSLENLHNELPLLKGNLPGLRTRCFLDDTYRFSEIPLKLETIAFLPESDLGVLIFRGELETNDRYPKNKIENLLLSYEHILDDPREIGYYEHALKNRTNYETALGCIMRDSDLSPKKSAEALLHEKYARSDEADRINKSLLDDWESYKQEMRKKNNISIPDDVSPSLVNPESVIAPAALTSAGADFTPLLEESNKSLQAAAAYLDEPIKEKLASVPSFESKNFDEVEFVNEAVNQARDRSSASDNLRNIKNQYEEALTSVSTVTPLPDLSSNANFPDPISEEKLSELRKNELLAKGLAITPSQDSRLRSKFAGKALRSVMTELIENNENLTNRDFSGADLSDIDFSGKDLRGCIFQGARIENSIFKKANLSEASLTGAQVSFSDFSGANLENANLSSVAGSSVSFESADLCGAYLMQVNLEASTFNNCKIKCVNANEAAIKESSFIGSKILDSSFLESDLRGCDFTDCQVERSVFVHSCLIYSRWDSASLSKVALYNTDTQFSIGEDTVFKGCQFAGQTFLSCSQFLESQFEDCGLRGVYAGSSSFKCSRFLRCDIGNIKFTHSDLSKCLFKDCLIHEADFRSALLRDASLCFSQCSGASFVEADLYHTNFFDSDVLLADFSGANYGDSKNIMSLKLQRLEDETRRVA